MGPISTTTGDLLVSAAEAVYGLVQYLNYATRDCGSTLPYASFGYRLMGQLAGAAQMQPSCISNLHDGLTHSRDPSVQDSHVCCPFVVARVRGVRSRGVQETFS